MNRNIKQTKVSVFILLGLISFSVFCGEGKKEIRVVSLSPCLTELIFHLGEGDKLVGRSSACDYPEKAKKVESVGAFGKPSLEKLISVNPTVVVASALADPAVKPSIEELGIKFILLPGKSIEDYYSSVQKLGEILNCREKAEKEIRRFKTQLGKYRKESDKSRKPKVYMEIWDRPYMTVGKRSFINDLIKYAGGNNIAAKRNEAYFNCSVEWIISSNPEVIICPAMKTGREADVKKRQGWSNIKAVKNGRIYVDLNDDLIYRLGPRTLEGIKLLNKLIHKNGIKK